MPAPDLFGILDTVRALTAPAGLEAAHVDGFSWAKNGLNYGSSTKLTASDWNRIIANLRLVLIGSGVDLTTLDPASPALLRDVLLAYIATAIVDEFPDLFEDNKTEFAAELAAIPAFVAAVAAAVPGSALLTTGGTMTGALVLAADPSAPLQPTTKQYVDALAANVGRRGTVRAATTANITIATALNNADALDGVTLATGDLVLVKDQTAPAENGIYVVGVTPARSSEYDSWNEHPGAAIVVQEGTVNAERLYLCTSNTGGTLGTTALVFSGVSIAVIDGAITFIKLAAAAIATAAEYRAGIATGKLLTIDQVNAAMAEVALTDAATIAWDMATGVDFTVTLGGNRTLGNPTNCVVGRRGRIRVVQDGTGSRTLTKSSNHKTASAAAIVLSTAAGAVDYIDYDCRSATDIRLSVSRAWG